MAASFFINIATSEILGATVVAPVAPVGTSLYIKGAWKGIKIKLLTFQIGYEGDFRCLVTVTF